MSAAPSRWARWADTLRVPFVARLLKVTLAAAVVASILVALRGYRGQMLGRLEHVSMARVAVALGMCLVYRVINAYGWVLVLRSLGHPMRAWPGVRIWLVSESLRWLPGSVWGMLSRLTQASAAGVPALAASVSVPLELLLTITAWTIAALVGFGASGTLGAWVSFVPTLWVVAVLLGGLATIGAVLVLARWTPTGGRIATKLHGMLGSLRQLRRSPPSATWLAVTLLFFVALTFFNGAAFMTTLAAASGSHLGLFASTGINAAGWLLGFFAFFAPSGLGVREATTTSLLAPLIPLDAAVVGVLLWRAIQVVVELVCLAGLFAPVAFSSVRRLRVLRRSTERSKPEGREPLASS